MESSHKKSKSGLIFVVNFYRVFGQSFLFWNSGRKMCLKLKVVLLILNTLLFIATVFYSYIDVEDVRNMGKDPTFFNPSHKSLMMFIMIVLVSICYSIMNLYVFGLILVRGKSILEFLHYMNIHIDIGIERRIGLKVIIIHLPIVFLMNAALLYCEVILTDTNGHLLNTIFHLLLNILIASSYMCLLSLLAYFSFVIEQKLSEINVKFTSLSELATIFKQILIVQNNVKQFKQFTSGYLFFIILLYSFACVSNLTILYFDRLKTIPSAVVSCFEPLSQIFLFCYLSDKLR